VFVLTHHLPQGAVDPSVTFVSGGVSNAVATALAAASGSNVVLLGATIPRQCIVAGLHDEIVVHVAPILLGDALRLHDAPGGASVGLEPLSAGRSGKLAGLRYRVVK
jgi:dihydrofolate reductase